MLMTAKEAKEGMGSPDVLVKGRSKVYGKSDLINFKWTYSLLIARQLLTI